MRYTIPLKPVPSQQVVCDVGGQVAIIIIRQLGGRQYFSVSTGGRVLCQNVLMLDRTWLIDAPYLGFTGDFSSIDTHGRESPVFTGWGRRFQLIYEDGAET